MNILFAGNSLTYYNDMPWLLHEMEASRGNAMYVRQMTRGGGRLAELNSLNSEHRERFLFDLHEKKWDYVVLQDQTFAPCENPAQFQETVAKLTAQIAETTAKPVLFETWAYKQGSKVLEDVHATYEQMRDGLHAAYRAASEKNRCILVPVGQVFDAANQKLPGVELYQPDCKHPALAGSYLCAAAFERFLFKAETPAFYVPDELDCKTAKDLWRIVLDL